MALYSDVELNVAEFLEFFFASLKRAFYPIWQTVA